ncbi:MAG: hypothetical protein ACYTG0_10075 [Planctomycetota bacterium]
MRRISRGFRRFAPLLALLLAAASASARADQAGQSPVKVFILAGQSNMVGNGLIEFSGRRTEDYRRKGLSEVQGDQLPLNAGLDPPEAAASSPALPMVSAYVPAGRKMVFSPSVALASITAARRVVMPEASRPKPSPGTASTVSSRLSTKRSEGSGISTRKHPQHGRRREQPVYLFHLAPLQGNAILAVVEGDARRRAGDSRGNHLRVSGNGVQPSGCTRQAEAECRCTPTSEFPD